jgi:PAS domain S-box-containing protein
LKLDIQGLRRAFAGSPAESNIRQETFSILQDVYQKMLPLIAAFTAISLLLSPVEAIYGMSGYLFWGVQVLLFLTIVVAALLRRRLSSLQMFVLILAVIYVLAVASLLNSGLAGSGIIHLAFLCVFSGLYLGIRQGFMMLVVSVVTMIIIGAGYNTGYILQKPDAAAFLLYPVNWAIHIGCIALYIPLLILSVKGLHKRMAGSQLDLKENNRQLAAEISTRKEAQIALIESEAKYRGVVENSVAGFFIVQNGMFRFVNQRCCDIAGYSDEEITGAVRGIGLIHPDDREKLASNIEKCLTTNAMLPPFDIRIIRKDGNVIIVQITVNITIYKNAEAVTGTFIDITREKLLETELRQAQKMEAVGQLAGGIAHDFNNILTVFNGYCSVLQMKMSKDDPLRIYVDQILSAAQKAASLTQNLLTFSRQQPFSIEPIDINQAILGTEKLLRHLLTEDIAFTLHLSQKRITALVDPTQLDRILFNLVSNARDAMPQGGNLILETDFVFLDNNFRETHGFGKSGRYAHITLADSGDGMDKNTLEKIFNPFFTTKAPGQGTGLGLTTVYAIVKQHNGFIIADSQPGQGTTFHLYLPAAGATARKEEPLPDDLRTGTERIMIADDDEDVRTFIRDALRLCGYQTVEAIDGEDAIAKFREAPEIDLVILDSVMPKKNGREVFNEIVKINPQIKALFISGYTHDVVLDKGISAEDVNFLSKPIALHLLLSKVREILDEGCKKHGSRNKRVFAVEPR